MAKVKAFTVENGTAPREILDLLGVRKHVVQARVLVFTTSNTRAVQRLDDLRLGWCTVRDVAEAHGNDVDLLTGSGLDQDGSAFVRPLDHFDGDGLVAVYGKGDFAFIGSLGAHKFRLPGEALA